MTTRRLAPGWVRFRHAGMPPWGGVGWRCSSGLHGDELPCLALYGNPAAEEWGVACDSPACVEAMGVFAAEPAETTEAEDLASDLAIPDCGEGGVHQPYCRHAGKPYGKPSPEPTPGPAGATASGRHVPNFVCSCGDCGVYFKLKAAYAELAALKVALDEAAELIARMAKTAGEATADDADEWLTRYDALKGTR